MTTDKKCKRCGLVKPVIAFSVTSTGKDGRSSTCKPCVAERNALYWKTPFGRISQVFAAQTAASKVREHTPPAYTSKELYTWAENNGLFLLHSAWENSNYQKDLIPSVDRNNPNLPYTLNNIRLVTWKENNDKAYEDRKSCRHITKQCVRIEQLTMAGTHVAYFDSVAMAARMTGGVRTNINRMCAGAKHIKSVKGFIWRYA